jgi:hypothetical protein
MTDRRRRLRGCVRARRPIRRKSQPCAECWCKLIRSPSRSGSTSTLIDCIAWLARRAPNPARCPPALGARLGTAGHSAAEPCSLPRPRRSPRAKIRRTPWAQARRSAGRPRERPGEKRQPEAPESPVRFSDDATTPASVRFSDGLTGRRSSHHVFRGAWRSALRKVLKGMRTSQIGR